MAGVSLQDIIKSDFYQEHSARAADWLGRRILDHCVAYERAFHRDSYDSHLEAAFALWFYMMQTGPDVPWSLHLEAQAEVTVNGRDYRLDFAVWQTDEHLPNGQAMLPLAIELDGHDFHERTKSQVERRNRRDRDLMANGWRVIHFAGSEFHRDPAGCIREVCAAANVLMVR